MYFYYKIRGVGGKDGFKNNDPEGVVEVIQAYLRVINKSKAAQK
jgi:hypothetical protein